MELKVKSPHECDKRVCGHTELKGKSPHECKRACEHKELKGKSPHECEKRKWLSEAW